METKEKATLKIESTINAPVEKVWEFWTMPAHIVKWNSPSDDWHSPRAENDLRVGGSFLARMEAKDGSFGFDFGGIYDTVEKYELIEYTLGDGRKVKIIFTAEGKDTNVVETFEAEDTHPLDFQQAGWQAILDNFKKYVEAA